AACVLAGQGILCLPFENEFPILGEAVIENISGCNEGRFARRAAEFGRPPFDLQFAEIGYRRVGGVEGAVGERPRGPERRAQASRQRQSGSAPLHCVTLPAQGAGRNTQIAAASACLGTATKSRSASGLNNAVRAPAVVGTCATRE